jgi:hypothetical protein
MLTRSSLAEIEFAKRIRLFTEAMLEGDALEKLKSGKY